ncbi:hypothetical protein RsTz2092_00060 [Deferribacterales bacterium RsTz2092]|nr:hypothetical protein AGMMS49941_00450 [Deferribacterales bacterium]
MNVGSITAGFATIERTYASSVQNVTNPVYVNEYKGMDSVEITGSIALAKTQEVIALNGYKANAKMLQTIDDMMGTIINIKA